MKHIKTLLLLLVVTNMHAQTPLLNLQKYWHYRQRLNDKFMIVSSGNEIGTNIPASIRKGVGIFTNALEFGDATVELSYYMAVLATEYRLLKDYNQPYTKTLDELHYAMLAFERLDYGAEYHYRVILNKPLYYYYIQGIKINVYMDETDFNGFFIRDDVDFMFTRTWAPVHPFFYETDSVTSDGIAGLAFDDITGDFIGIKPNAGDDIYKAEMSQDQVWNLVTAFAIIEEMLADNTTLYNDINGNPTTMRQWAINTTKRVLQYMKVTYKSDGLVDIYTDYWAIANPVTAEIVHRGGSKSDLYPFAGLFSAVGTKITGTQIHNSIYEPIFDVQLPAGNYWSDHGQLLLRSCLDSSKYNYLYSNSLNYIDELPFTFEHAPVINLLLSKNKNELYFNNDLDSYIESLLNSAPYNGPFNYGDSTAPGFSKRWSGTCEYSNPFQAFQTYNNWFSGEYNGLDYMLLHNLYWLTFVQKLPLTDNCIYGTLPGADGFASVNSPLTYGGNYKTFVQAEFLSGSKVTLTSGTSIYFKTGTKFVSGSSFKGSVRTVQDHNYPDYINTEYNYWCYTPSKKSGKKSTESSFMNVNQISNLKASDIAKNVASDFNVFPNPFSKSFSVQLDTSDPVVFKIYTVNGECLMETTITGHQNIDMSSYPTGVYLVKGILHGNVISKKIVKTE